MTILSALPPQPEDKIIAVMGQFAADPRPEKLDLGVGVYRDDAGQTPILRAVKAAESANQAEETSKSYNRLIGDAGYLEAVEKLVLAEAHDPARVTSSQTPGGTGALRCLFELVMLANADATVWLPEPTWPNHIAILSYLGIKTRTAPYYDHANGQADVEAFLAGLGGVKPGDVVLLHGACHNPTGADPSPEGWQAIAEHASTHGWVPLIDLAYHGLGDGLNEDAQGVRLLAQKLPEVLIAVSFSKTFGLYRDRAGAALAITQRKSHGVTEDTLSAINRLAYSFAPHPAAAIVRRILTSPDLRHDWEAELGEMRGRMSGLRSSLSDALRLATNTDLFEAVATQRGMFSQLPIDPRSVSRLRAEFGIYMVGDGRINIAGLTEEAIPRFSRAVATVCR
ncbi:MAG: aromatic amino acid transaminase [Pseudomonadota bacterium]